MQPVAGFPSSKITPYDNTRPSYQMDDLAKGRLQDIISVPAAFYI
jgi:hypothetical protein